MNSCYMNIKPGDEIQIFAGRNGGWESIARYQDSYLLLKYIASGRDKYGRVLMTRIGTSTLYLSDTKYLYKIIKHSS